MRELETLMAFAKRRGDDSARCDALRADGQRCGEGRLSCLRFYVVGEELRIFCTRHGRTRMKARERRPGRL